MTRYKYIDCIIQRHLRSYLDKKECVWICFSSYIFSYTMMWFCYYIVRCIHGVHKFVLFLSFFFFSKLFVCFLFVFPPSIINSFSKKKILYYYYYYYRSILLFLAICITRVWSIQYNIVPPPSSSSILNWSWHHRYSCVFNWPLFTFSKDYPGSLL